MWHKRPHMENNVTNLDIWIVTVRFVADKNVLLFLLKNVKTGLDFKSSINSTKPGGLDIIQTLKTKSAHEY